MNFLNASNAVLALPHNMALGSFHLHSIDLEGICLYLLHLYVNLQQMRANTSAATPVRVLLS